MKKSIALIFAASTLFLAGCCTTPHASQWEYKVASHPYAAGATQAFLNDLGKEGWVLVQVDGMMYYFKRPIK